MYRRVFRGEYILLAVYVDDLLYTGSSNELLEQFEKNLAGRFDITCNYDVKQFLGLKISYSPEAIHLLAAKYAEELGKRFNIAPAPLSTPYRTPGPNHKPDNKAFGLSNSSSPRPMLGLCYSTIPTASFNLVGYVDADHAADPDNRRSRTGFLFRLEPSGPISWNSQKQELVALSSAEAEFIAATAAIREGLYLQELLHEAKITASPNFRLHSDNQSAIRVANKPECLTFSRKWCVPELTPCNESPTFWW
ncbi:unnamed protein product [Closterium sp. NIES-54]